MVRSLPLGKQEIPHPNSGEYEKIYSGDFVNVQRLLPPYGLCVLARVLLFDNKQERECLVDASFYAERGWDIFDGFFKFSLPVSFSVIAWTWNPKTGKPSKFTTLINPIPIQF